MLAVVLATAVLAALATLAPSDAAWSVPLRVTALGQPLQRQVGVAVLLRLATHPLAARAVDGRELETAQGRWQIESHGAPGQIAATCAPCRFTLAALGPAPVQLARARITIAADGADQYHGRLELGSAPHTLALAWQARFDRQGRMQLEATLPPTPLHDAVLVFGSDIPERASMRGRRHAGPHLGRDPARRRAGECSRGSTASWFTAWAPSACSICSAPPPAATAATPAWRRSAAGCRAPWSPPKTSASSSTRATTSRP